MIRKISFIAGCVLFCSVASAQYGDFTLSGGYSRLFTAKSGGLSFGRDGAYIDSNFAWHVPGADIPLYAGFGVAGSGYWQTTNGPVTFDRYGNAYYYSLYSDIENFELEPRIALKLVIPGLRNFYFRPQLGAGLLINNYSIDTVSPVGINSYYYTTLYHTGAAFDIHPNMQAGWQFGPGSIGFELGYLIGFGGFGRMGSTQQELHVGLFARYRF